MRRDPAGITPEQRQRIIDEISSGQLDIASAATKYNIPQMVINRWLNVATATNDQKARNQAYRNILVRLQDIACVLPLFSYTTFYAFSKQLDLMPALDDVPRFYSARWK